MRRLLELIVCIALMGIFGWFIHTMIYGITPNFGHGFAAGIAVMTILFWVVWKLDPSAFSGSKARSELERPTNVTKDW
jgi:hypothetical protein